MAYDEDLATRIRTAIGKRPSISEKKMFGGIAFLHRGYMFCGIAKGKLMARVGPENYEKALRQRHVRPMDFTGKPLKGYVYVEAAGCNTPAAAAKWVEKCLAFVKTLPAKRRA